LNCQSIVWTIFLLIFIFYVWTILYSLVLYVDFYSCSYLFSSPPEADVLQEWKMGLTCLILTLNLNTDWFAFVLLLHFKRSTRFLMFVINSSFIYFTVPRSSIKSIHKNCADFQLNKDLIAVVWLSLLFYKISLHLLMIIYTIWWLYIQFDA